jgi:gamma-butyrobetaine dioxygenase
MTVMRSFPVLRQAGVRISARSAICQLRRNSGAPNFNNPAAKKLSTRGEAHRSAHSQIVRVEKNLDVEADGNPNLVTIGSQSFHPVFLRDACSCPRCIDPSSKQKNFQTTDIPPSIRPVAAETQADGTVNIKWDNDLPGFGEDHVSSYPKTFFEINSSHSRILQEHFEPGQPKLWENSLITTRLQFVDYEDYMTKDAALYQVLQQLLDYGLLLVRGVPKSEKSVENIAERIGRLRDSFYGRTWDVKSVPQAKNVAYTAQYLGLHMDLLYMTNPPGFQFLHCLENTCEGGSSIFSDSFYAASKLSEADFNSLCHYQIPYHYRNANEHYHFRRPVIELKNDPDGNSGIEHINYSPPFQANHAFPGNEQKYEFNDFMLAFRRFVSKVEAEENLYEYRLQEGECVIFNNRRVLHGRRQFDTSTGERWFKGCYVDTDVFMSRYRVLAELKANDQLPLFNIGNVN